MEQAVTPKMARIDAGNHGERSPARTTRCEPPASANGPNCLDRRVSSLRLDSYEEYYALLTAHRAEHELARFGDAVGTNETYFFRGGTQLAALATVVLPQLFRAHRSVRIWSAGCSTGEDVYTLRIVADQAARAAGVPEPEIVGTDVSTAAIARAREGVYNDRSLGRVPPDVLRRCFVPRRDGAWQVNEEARARVSFRVHNLFVDRPPWDVAHVIFCRNVLIHFNKPIQEKLVDRVLARAVHPDGYLFIGNSESLSGLTREFVHAPELNAAIYRRSDRGAATGRE